MNIGRDVDPRRHNALLAVLMAVLPALSLGAILLFDTLISQSRASSAPSGRAPTPTDAHPRNP